MIKKYVVLVACLAVIQSTFAAWNPEDAKRIRWDESGNYPSFVRFEDGKGPKLTELYPFLKEMLGLGTGDRLRLKRSTSDKLGYVHYDFEQLHEGFPVAYSSYKAHFLNGRAVTLNGRISRIESPAAPSLGERDALVIALADVKAESYMWEIPSEVEALRYAKGDPTANFLPVGELKWIGFPGAMNSQPRLAWRFDMYAHKPMARKEIFVDALTGEVLFRQDLIHTSDVQATAVTFYSGIQMIVTDSTGSLYRLRETGRASGVETYNMQNGTNYGAAVDFTDADNYWDNINANNDHAAADGHWGAEMTFDYFWLEHGRNSFDGSGSKLLSYIHYDQNYSNAFWDGTRMTYGSANNNARPFCALDVVAHEFSHGLTGTSAGLVYAYESGALNESFSDIFGAAIEFYARPGNANWEIGEDLGGIRDMADPAQFFNPDTYLGSFWVTGSFDNGGVHTNSGVQNFWFYLLSDGGNGVNDNGDAYSVSALGIDTAAMIAFRNLTTYLGPQDQYADARYYAIEAAEDLFGECSHQVIQTVNAWHAVGVGNAYTGTLAAAFYSTDTNNCQIPSTVAFQNNSLSAFSYEWDFGDGGTSTSVNPTHTYTAAGTYTVTLIAIGCNGQRDTLVIPNFVVLDPNAPCIVNMPSENEQIIHQGCEGELYDSGGNENYQNGTASVITIVSTPGTSINLSFLTFGYLAGDNIKIYDGDSTNSPLIGTYSGTNLPPSVVSSSNYLTIKESTNGFGNTTGFHAVWSCAVSNNPVQAIDLKVFPNPASDRVSVSFPGSGGFNFSLLDVQGRVMMKGNTQRLESTQLSLKSLASGVYFLRVESKHGTQVRKLVKE